MNEKLPITVLTYRIEKIEQKLEDLQDKLNLSLQNLNSEVILLKQLKDTKPSVKIEITKENRKDLKNGRRTSQVSSERWNKWKQQLDSGMSIAQVANDWGCSRKAIYYAINKQFRSNCNKKNICQNNVD
jgi:predicted DNA-binding protein YlxM (UPF0122 family)